MKMIHRSGPHFDRHRGCGPKRVYRKGDGAYGAGPNPRPRGHGRCLGSQLSWVHSSPHLQQWMPQLLSSSIQSQSVLPIHHLSVQVGAGERIAQLCIEKVFDGPAIEIDKAKMLKLKRKLEEDD